MDIYSIILLLTLIILNGFKYCYLTLIVLLAHSLSSSSRRATSTNIPDPLSPLLPIVHRLVLFLTIRFDVLNFV